MEAYGVGKIFTNGPESAMQQIVPGFDIKEKIRNSAFFFVNSDENVDFTMPITPKLIFTGGIQESVPKTLEKPFLDIFKSAKKGVIYFSPGKIVESQSMPENLRKAFLEAFGEFPEVNFFWNFGNGAEKIGKTPKNVFIFENAPENAILENSKTLAFINHAEMDAVNSGIMKGIPMIAIPVFADQFHNAKILELQNVGETVSKNEITKENLVNKIKKIVENESYKKNAEKLAKIINAKVIKAEERIVKFTEFAAKFGDSETLQTEGRKLAFFFVNSDENVDFTMPITPKLIFTGGIQESTSETLEKPFLDIFDTAKKGVIYFSPGKIVESQSMPENLKKAFLEAFGEFPEINFIWNFGNGAEKVGKTPKNVFVFETAPENAILENSKTLAFINHAEMDAVNSGIMKGIPMIAIPVFADQFHNAKILERQNVGETVSKNEITKENLINKIKKIVENESYKKNAEKLAKIINAKVIKAEERIVKFTEFAAKFGDSETLQTEGRKLGWIQLYSLDVVLFVVIVLVTIILGFFKLIKKATKKVQQIIQKPSTTKKNN
uniref:Glucuronosyltransferase n=1 Tax=Panagrolaimus sp. JU765 TaxID=591449 RepID=A0AC34RBY8_9BILA